MRSRIGQALAALAMASALVISAGCMARTEEQAASPASPSASPASPSPAQPAIAEGSISMGAITVTARSEVKVVPDKASFGVGIDTEGADANAAQTANAEVANAVIARLKELGIDEKSIQTSWTNLNPIWDYSGTEERIPGYSMSTRINVSDIDVDKVGELMRQCVEAGATSIDGPQFYASSYDEAYQDARVAAIEAARPKAEAIARASGVSLGGVVGVTEGHQDYSVYYGAMAADAGMGMAEEAKLDVEPGEVSVEAQVTVSYAIG